MNIKLPACYDTSHWEIVPDFALLSPRPLLVITKATESLSFVDNTFVRYFEDLKQDGIHRGAYHFFRKAADATKQAQHFCNTVRPYVTDKDLLVLDVEEGGETAAQLKTWFDFVRSQFPRNRFMVYSRKNILDPIPMTQTQKDYFKQIPTWVAGYPLFPDNWSSVPPDYIPDQSKWGVVWLWQYTDNGNVAGASTDGTDCNWMSPVLVALLGDTIPPDNGGYMFFKVLVSLNARSSPENLGGANDIGDFKIDDIVETPTLGVVNAGVTWRQVTRLWRNGFAVALPVSPTGKVFAAEKGGSIYMQEVQFTPPDTTSPVVSIVQESNFTAKTVTITKTRKDGTSKSETDPIE